MLLVGRVLKLSLRASKFIDHIIAKPSLTHLVLFRLRSSIVSLIYFSSSKVIMTVMSSPSNSLAEPALLNKIDQLFACNVGSYIDLPQLVVVGDQSSGKSSVLGGMPGRPSSTPLVPIQSLG